MNFFIRNQRYDSILRIHFLTHTRRIILPFLFIAAALFCHAAYAQGTHITKKRLSKPISSISVTHEYDADFKAEGYGDNPSEAASVSLTETAGGISFPLFMHKRLRLMSGVRAAWYHFMFDNVELENIDAWSVSIPFTAISPVTEKMSVMCNLSPGIHTDFNRVNHNDVKTAFLLLANYKWSPALTLSGGMAYSRVFGDDEYFPAVGLDWQPNDSWSVRLMFPTPAVRYFINARSRIALGFSPAGGKWNIEDPRTINNDNEEYDFEFKGWRIGLGYEYDITKRLTLLADVGSTLRREYTIENDNDTLMDSDVDDTLSIRIGLLLNR